MPQSRAPCRRAWCECRGPASPCRRTGSSGNVSWNWGYLGRRLGTAQEGRVGRVGDQAGRQTKRRDAGNVNFLTEFTAIRRRLPLTTRRENVVVKRLGSPSATPATSASKRRVNLSLCEPNKSDKIVLTAGPCCGNINSLLSLPSQFFALNNDRDLDHNAALRLESPPR